MSQRGMKHKLGGLLFALGVGALVMWVSLQWIAGNTERRERRAVEEAIVLQARSALGDVLGEAERLQIVDPLNPNRVAGKVFIYPIDEGWQVSGHYRYEAGTRWYPWLMNLSAEGALESLSAGSPEGAVEYPR